MAELKIFVEQCVVRPSATLLEKAYQDYLTDSAPCKVPSVKNQCAVRMSIALARCGFGLESFSPQNRVHRNRSSCQQAIPHVLGANELARFLKTCWPTYETFLGRSLRTAAATLK